MLSFGIFVDERGGLCGYPFSGGFLSVIFIDRDGWSLEDGFRVTF